MKLLALLSVFLALPLAAQTPAPLPTYVLAGASFNQIGTPQVNLIAGAVYPTGSSTVEYMSTVVNIIPKLATTSTGKKFYSFETTATQSLHKIIWRTPKYVVLLGGGAGASFSQASPSGTNVNLAASFTATAAFQLSPKWGVAVPIQGIYTSQGWDLIPAVAVVFKP